MKTKTKQLSKPWINNNILFLIKEKHKFYKKYLRHRNLDDLIRFKIARNRINHEIRRSKYYYLKNYLMTTKTTSKKQWSAVNLITQNRKSNSNHITLFNNGELIQDQKKSIRHHEQILFESCP